MKKAFMTELGLHHFGSDMDTFLVMDASCLNGLGFALIQSRNVPTQPERLIQCGSHCLMPCKKNYATIELECLAMAWALKKCDYFFLHGMNFFSIITNHRPLVGIFEKPLCEVVNPRISRIWEKMLPFNFEINWLEGKFNVITDALSQNLIGCG